MKKESQTVRVAKRLVKYGSITTSEAMSQMYITRLAARIGNIKDAIPIEIDVEMIKWGDSRQARYSVNEKEKFYLNHCLNEGQL